MRMLIVISILVVGIAGCGGGSSTTSNATESSPPGDIPDNQAFVAYRPPGGGFSVKVPEGWSRIDRRGTVTFTDKLNSIGIRSAAAGAALTPAAARRAEVPRRAQTPTVSAVSRPAGRGLRISYLIAAAPNAVTGKAGTDAVERYVFFHKGQQVVLTLSGPKGADNVDPWRIVTDSLRWTR